MDFLGNTMEIRKAELLFLDSLLSVNKQYLFWNLFPVPISKGLYHSSLTHGASSCRKRIYWVMCLAEDFHILYLIYLYHPIGLFPFYR